MDLREEVKHCLHEVACGERVRFHVRVVFQCSLLVGFRWKVMEVGTFVSKWCRGGFQGQNRCATFKVVSSKEFSCFFGRKPDMEK